jgi:sortase A
MRAAPALMLALCLAGLGMIASGLAIPAKAAVAQLLLERAFDRSLATLRPHKPWPWADMAPIARVSVRRLGIDRIVLDGGSGQAMAFGPTLLPSGAGIGRRGTIVLAAHRDTHFRFLEHLRRGDLIELQGADGAARSYRMAGAEIVRWDRFSVGTNMQTSGLDLSTCYPFDALGHGPLRYVVHAMAVTVRTPEQP